MNLYIQNNLSKIGLFKLKCKHLGSMDTSEKINEILRKKEYFTK